MSAAFADKFRVIALAPGLRPEDLLRSQDTPDILLMNVAEFARQQRSRPVGVARRWRSIQHARASSDFPEAGQRSQPQLAVCCWPSVARGKIAVADEEHPLFRHRSKFGYFPI